MSTSIQLDAKMTLLYSQRVRGELKARAVHRVVHHRDAVRARVAIARQVRAQQHVRHGVHVAHHSGVALVVEPNLENNKIACYCILR